jgi:hypothetical protein
MGVNDLKKWNHAKMLNGTSHNPTDTISRIESIPLKKSIHVSKTDADTPLPCHAAILDFEGNPVFMVGLMIGSTCFTYYIEHYKFRRELYLLLLTIISTSKEIIYFTFSDHEHQELTKIHQYLECQGIDLQEYNTIDSIPLINLQLTKFESIIEALYSIQPEMKITGDALFRNTRMVDQLFYAKKYEEIIRHNQNCLRNESIILQKRWLKLYNV